MDTQDFDRPINESQGISTTPTWIAQAVLHKDKNMTVGLAHSMLYRVKPIDRALGTIPLIENIKTEVN